MRVLNVLTMYTNYTRLVRLEIYSNFAILVWLWSVDMLKTICSIDHISELFLGYVDGEESQSAVRSQPQPRLVIVEKLQCSLGPREDDFGIVNCRPEKVMKQ